MEFELTMKIRQVTDVTIFNAPNGNRRIYMPYYVLNEHGTFIFEHIHYETDAMQLMQWVEQGIVFTFSYYMD